MTIAVTFQWKHCGIMAALCFGGSGDPPGEQKGLTPRVFWEFSMSCLGMIQRGVEGKQFIQCCQKSSASKCFFQACIDSSKQGPNILSAPVSHTLNNKCALFVAIYHFVPSFSFWPAEDSQFDSNSFITLTVYSFSTTAGDSLGKELSIYFSK